MTKVAFFPEFIAKGDGTRMVLKSHDPKFHQKQARRQIARASRRRNRRSK